MFDWTLLNPSELYPTPRRLHDSLLYPMFKVEAMSVILGWEKAAMGATSEPIERSGGDARERRLLISKMSEKFVGKSCLLPGTCAYAAAEQVLYWLPGEDEYARTYWYVFLDVHLGALETYCPQLSFEVEHPSGGAPSCKVGLTEIHAERLAQEAAYPMTNDAVPSWTTPYPECSDYQWVTTATAPNISVTPPRSTPCTVQHPIPAGATVTFDNFACSVEKDTCVDDAGGRIATYFEESNFPPEGYAATFQFIVGLETCAMCAQPMNWFADWSAKTTMQVLEPNEYALFSDVFPSYCHTGCINITIPKCVPEPGSADSGSSEDE